MKRRKRVDKIHSQSVSSVVMTRVSRRMLMQEASWSSSWRCREKVKKIIGKSEGKTGWWCCCLSHSLTLCIRSSLRKDWEQISSSWWAGWWCWWEVGTKEEKSEWKIRKGEEGSSKRRVEEKKVSLVTLDEDCRDGAVRMRRRSHLTSVLLHESTRSGSCVLTPREDSCSSSQQ